MNALRGPADSLGRISLWLVAFLPFVNPIHSMPIPSFYSEWLAATLGFLVICFFAVATRSATRLLVPVVVLLPLGLTAVILIQLAVGHTSHPRYALLYCCFLILATALITVGRMNSERLGLDQYAKVIASALVAGALIQSFAVLLQRADLALPWFSFPGRPGASSGGLLGQRNHLVDYLWMGIASTLYLTVTQRFSMKIGVAVTFLLAVASILPGSRSAFLYPFGLALISALAWFRSGRIKVWRNITLASLFTIPVMFAADHWLQIASSAALTATERLAAPEIDPVRSGLLQVAWLASMDRPLAGYGVGTAPSVTFELSTAWPDHTRPVVAEHFHNLAAQWLIEFGMPATLVATAFVLYWLGASISRARQAEHWWLLSLLTVVGLHSQLEYPLWLAYFLVPISLFAGPLGPTFRTRLQFRPRHLLVAGTGLATTGLILVSLWQDYRHLEFAAAASGPGMGQKRLEQAIATALALEKNSLLAPQAIVLLAGAMGVSSENAPTKWGLCRQALQISPTQDVAMKCAAIAAVNGNIKEGSRLLQMGTAAYGTHSSWQSLQKEFPELQNLENGSPKTEQKKASILRPFLS